MTSTRQFKRVLVANRGEIATRVFRACTELGKQTIAIYSDEDSLALHRYKADEAYLIGEGKAPVQAYLDIEGIVALAKRVEVDAIHPGYGFLSENADFARACAENGIVFIGPRPEQLELFGDKVSARATALQAGLPVIPGSQPLAAAEDALLWAREHGYPIIVKAVMGGGGRGMRVVRNKDELLGSLERARAEAAGAFGSAAVYLERYIERPRHIEVQVLGDAYGHHVHLFERDCSVQRRHQKVVEVAPAQNLSEALRKKICGAAVELVKSVGYVNAGTVEFLLAPDGNFYFIEVNPRIQVEHTITEQITGIDLVQTQVRIAEGFALADPVIGIPSQKAIQRRGAALQCRVTTEDPHNGFLPDTGRISAYRSGGGLGIRLDGNAHSGAIVSPHYDSLLVKVSAWALSFDNAAQKMLRELREFRIRGVKTNLPFLMNVVTHPDFLQGRADTTFIETHPELMRLRPQRDRGTRLMRYIAHTVVAGGPGLRPGVRKPRFERPRLPELTVSERERAQARAPLGAKAVLDRDGPEAFARWTAAHQSLLLCDTTMRDAHQSLLATRVRTHDIVVVAEATGVLAPQLYSLECWGGATFDASLRFLKEDPWERLALLRRQLPHTPLQMLLRGANAVGYNNYPDNVVREFVREAAAAGVDIFRVFDCMNWLPNIRPALAAVREAGKVAEGAICYTGDILDPSRTRYTLRYYVDLAREVAVAGAHILCIKDMAGLLKPQAAAVLVPTLKEATGLPVHLHTHDSAGTGVATILAAAAVGLDVADSALPAMSGATSQPSLGAVVAALAGSDRDTCLNLDALQRLDDYWQDVRSFYAPFETGLRSTSTEVYRHEMPGGQYTNLQAQSEALGLGGKWDLVKRTYAEVNQMLGDLIKVTPSSKMVGDFALFMVKNGLSTADVRQRAAELSFPDSVVQFFAGGLGQPPGGFDRELQRAVLKGQEPITHRPGELLEPVDFAAVAAGLQEKLGQKVSNRDALTEVLYPGLLGDLARHREDFGDTGVLDTPTFFYGLRLGEETRVEIEPGKTLVMRLTAVGEPGSDGGRIVYFELNGQPREVRVYDPAAPGAGVRRPRAERGNKRHVGASMPGKVLKVLVQPGDTVTRGEQLLVTEAMKMITALTAPVDGTVKEVLVRAGDAVESGDLLLILTD